MAQTNGKSSNEFNAYCGDREIGRVAVTYDSSALEKYVQQNPLPSDYELPGLKTFTGTFTPRMKYELSVNAPLSVGQVIELKFLDESVLLVVVSVSGTIAKLRRIDGVTVDDFDGNIPSVTVPMGHG